MNEHDQIQLGIDIAVTIIWLVCVIVCFLKWKTWTAIFGIIAPILSNIPIGEMYWHHIITEPGAPAGQYVQGGVTTPDQSLVAECGIRPTRLVSSATELNALLRSNFTGRVIIPRDANWEMKQTCGAYDELGRCVDTPMTYIPLKTCVELVGERGDLGSRPLLYTDYKIEGYPLFDIAGNNIRVQGIHFRGPNAGARDAESLPHKVSALRLHEDPDPNNDGRAEPQEYVGRNVEIADNEFNEWAEAVQIYGRGSEKPCEDYGEDFQGPRVTRTEAGLVRVLRNYLHHNARDSSGYGVVIGSRAYATIEGNVFDFNRHAVAADCQRFNGYVARFNYVLQGGYTYGSNGYYGSHFDAHGAGTAQSRSEGHYDGGGAGEYYLISQNTIRGEQNYGGFLGFWAQTRPAFGLRGKPEVGAFFQENVVVHEKGEAIRLKNGDDDTLDPDDPHSFNCHSSGNRFDADYASELAAGDFDGDGRTDVFVANGTAWFFSRAGKRPWEFLHASTKRLEELGFADVDNDAVTDVLYRDGAGNVGYLKSGRYALVPLTTMPVALKDLRVGDFDGDGKTDLFFTRNGGWHVWYGSTRTWTPTQTSDKKISELLFGEFDDVKGTDVATVLESGWVYSSGSIDQWAPLNSKLTDSFSDAVAADFDGNGKADIAFKKGFWRISADGRGPMADLQAGSIKLNRWIVGRFESGAPAMAVHFGPPVSSVSKRFVIWRGLGSGKTLHPWSEHEMQ
jgi:hypothetical protein